MRVRYSLHSLPPLRAYEEKLIEAVLEWATEEHRVNGKLPDTPIKVATPWGELVLRLEPSVLDEDEDPAVTRARNLELD